MEILKSTFKQGGKRAFALALALILLISGLLLASAQGEVGVAYADNGNIGASAGFIEIADVTENKVSATFSSRDNGIKLKITLPLASTNVYFAYEVDSSEPVWAINGDADIDDDIPYVKHAGAVESFVVPSATIMEQIESSWTDVSEVYEKRVFYIEVHYNGTLYVACDMSGETEMLTASANVKDIDNLAPKMEVDRIVHGVVGEGGVSAFGVKLTFVDVGSTGMLSSERSGLKEILILRTDLPIGELTEEAIENGGAETVCAWELLSPLQALLTQSVTFNLQKDGYYYYFVVDRVGNLQIGTVFEGKFQREDHAGTDDRFMIEAGQATFSIKNYMVEIGQELNDYKDETNSDVYNKALESYSALLLRCYTGDALTDPVDVGKDWFSFFNGPYTTFKNAYSIGATYRVELVNGDLLDGTLEALNLNKNTLPSLGGDEVVAQFIVAKYELSALPEELLTASGLSGEGYALKLSYTLTVSGVQSRVPDTKIQYEFMSLPEELEDFAVVIKTDSGYTVQTLTKGENWLRFESGLNGAEYYLVCVYSEEETDLTWLWITLGVVGGIIVAGGIAVLVLFKLGKLKFPTKKPTTATTEQGASSTDDKE